MAFLSLLLVAIWLVGNSSVVKGLQCSYRINEAAPCIEQGIEFDLDKLIYNGTLWKNAVPFFKRDEYFTFPTKGSRAWHIITGLRVINRMAPEDQGTVTLTDGGVGYETMTIHVKSKRSRGFNFLVQVFGTAYDYGY